MSIILVIALLRHGFLSPFVWIAVIGYLAASSPFAASLVLTLFELNPFSLNVL